MATSGSGSSQVMDTERVLGCGSCEIIYSPGQVARRVRAEVLEKTDVLASVGGTSNVSISPGVEQTAYGVFADLVDVTRG